MKVCQITHTFLPEFIGGREIHVYNLAKALAVEGIETQVITGGHSNRSGFDDSLQNVSVTRLPRMTIPLARGSLNFNQRVLPFLPFVLMKSGADVIHAHDYYHLSSDMSAWVSRVTGKPLVLSIHSNLGLFSVNKLLRMMDKTYNRSLGKATLNQASKIIFMSRSAAREFLDKGMVAENKVRVIYPSINIDEFDKELAKIRSGAKNFYARQFGLTDNQVILSVGRIEERKGLQHIISSIPELVTKFPALKLVIIGGDAGYLSDLKRMIARMGLDQYVIFAGMLSDEEVMEAMYFADVFVLPSEHDNFPETALRVAYLGTPIVASNVGGIPEFVEDGETGLLTNAGDSHGLARAIERLLTDSELADKLAANARDKVSREYTMQQMVAKTIKVYEEVLRR